MKELKFRAWTGVDFFYSKGMGLSLFFKHAEGLKITQYTGLRDKNSRSIFEGDVLSCDNRLYEVCINFNGFYLQRYKLFRGKFKPSFQYGMSLITKPFPKGSRGEEGGIVESAEIIGNIYENPELLEKMIVA